MATNPKFGGTPRVACAIVDATLDTSLTAPTHSATVITGVAAGTKIEEIVIEGLGTTVAAVCNIFLYDGTTYHLYDQVLITAVTSSTTAIAFRRVRTYENLMLADNTWSLRYTQTVAGNQSLLKMTVTGEDLT